MNVAVATFVRRSTAGGDAGVPGQRQKHVSPAKTVATRLVRYGNCADARGCAQPRARV